MTKSFRERRDFVIGELQKMPGIKINMPEGAFYAFPNISSNSLVNLTVLPL